MHTSSGLRVRRSLTDLQDDYTNGNKKPLEDLVRAWKGIKALPPDDPHSFFKLGGFHGEPFRGAGWGDASYWGGYCHHGNILFPVWHRVYLVKLEEALRTIPGCEEVTMLFWDEASADSIKNGIPWALTQKEFVLDGQTIDNPLRSFVFPTKITDHISTDDGASGDNANYSKPLGYETVRYPLSGLVGTDKEKQETDAHNAKFPDYDTNVKILNANIVNWLTTTITVGGKVVADHVAQKYRDSLDAPNYTVFSNTTSMTEWNDNLPSGTPPVVALESPHNKIHLAVGGFDVPGQGDASQIPDANGDMGENDTAALDPIFFFHHCFVDRVFWLWQKKHGFTEHLEVIAEYPGTNSVDSQGPTPGVTPNSWLTLESPLDPFKLREHGKERAYTSLDCVNIEKQLGFTYGPGSLEETAQVEAEPATVGAKTVRVSGLNRARVRGSFLISAYATVDGKRQCIGTEAVLSRWNVRYCANCQTHLEVKAFMGLHRLPIGAVDESSVEVEVRTRDGRMGQPKQVASVLPVVQKKPFRFELR